LSGIWHDVWKPLLVLLATFPTDSLLQRST